MNLSTKTLSLLLTFGLLFIWLTTGLLAQKKKCMFISSGASPASQDVVIYNWLLETYDVDIATGSEVSSGYYTIDEYKEYDFLFVSETINSSDTAPLKGAPVPMFFTELWSSKWDVTGWAPTNSSPAYYGNTTSSETVIKIVDGDHPLAAGFATGTEITLVTGSDNATDYLTYSVPGIDYIKIAVLTADENKVVVLGVEKGTAIYNAENTKDGSMVTESRCAGVGVNANANNFLVEDGFTLMAAGIEWIMETSTAIEDEINLTPNRFQLDQNYPNPFNPTTTLSFTLAKQARTVLTLHNILGQEVATLIDADMPAGQHTVTFNGENLQSGLYFYTISSGDYCDTKKMMLIK
jgi:hypothetical protein